MHLVKELHINKPLNKMAPITLSPAPPQRKPQNDTYSTGSPSAHYFGVSRRAFCRYGPAATGLVPCHQNPALPFPLAAKQEINR